MAENTDLIFNVGLEVDTSKVKKDIEKIRQKMPVVSVPVTTRESMRQKLISAKSGEHTSDVRKLTELGFQEYLAGAKTAKSAIHNITSGVAGIGQQGRLMIGRATTDLETMIKIDKAMQAQNISQANIERVVSYIDDSKKTKDYTPLQQAEIIGMGRRFQRIPNAQQTEQQKKIIEAANELSKNLEKNTDKGTAFVTGMAKLGTAIYTINKSIQMIGSGLKEAQRYAGIGFSQARNPLYNPGYTNWLTRTGMSKQGAEQLQSEMMTFMRRLQMGQISQEELRAYGMFGGDIFGILKSNKSFEQKVMGIIREIRKTTPEDREQLRQSSSIVNLLVDTLAYSDADIMAEYEGAMAVGAKEQARVSWDLKNKRQTERLNQNIEKQRANFHTAMVGGKTGAGIGGILGSTFGAALGLGAGILMAPLTGGFSLAATLPLIAGGAVKFGALGALGGGAIGGASGAVVDIAQQSGSDWFDYNKVIPVQDVGQREINIENNIYMDSEKIIKQTQHQMLSSAEMGGV